MKHRVFIGILILLTAPLAFCEQTGLDQARQSIRESITSRIIHMAEEMALEDYDFEVEFNQLNSNLKLAVCEEKLHLDLPNQVSLGRSQVKVSCQGQKPWALNVPFNINLHAEVVVLNQPVSRKTPLKAHHLDYRKANLADQRNGYYLKKELVIGKQSKRALSGGTVLNGHLILPALLVHKGDRVMIVAKRGSMSVKMPGEAMNDGREGRQIRVKNIRSNRIVRAKVVDSGLVVVNF